MVRPSRRDLALTCEALYRLVREDYPDRPLRDLVFVYGGRLTPGHLDAAERIEQWLLASETDNGSDDDSL